jgi:hypothetical protein
MNRITWIPVLAALLLPLGFAFADSSHSVENDYFKIVSSTDGKALDVQEAGAEEGSAAIVSPWNGSISQQWRFVNVGDDWFRIANRASGQDLNIAGQSTRNNAAVELRQYGNLGGQQWKIDPAGGGFYRLGVRSGGNLLAVRDRTGQVVQRQASNDGSQLWRIEKVGTYRANEVYKSGSAYVYLTDGVIRGRTDDLATAIQNAIGDGDRILYLGTGGTLSRTVDLKGGLTLDGGNHTLLKSGGGQIFKAKNQHDITVRNLNLEGNGGMGMRFSGCNNVTCTEIHVKGFGIGIRVDSVERKPWEAWSYNFNASNCTFEGGSSHGIETYSIDGYNIQSIRSTNMGECGVLINRSRNGIIGTVYSTDCSPNKGYAGLRFANSADGCTVSKVISIRCGRGFFTCTGSKNIIVGEVYIRDSVSHAVLIQSAENVRIEKGSYNGYTRIMDSTGSHIGATKVE